MPNHTYEPIPLEEQDPPRDRHYFSGIPSTAPPSFRTSESATHLPHRNDETAATIMPRNEQYTQLHEMPSIEQIDEPAISLWGLSESSVDTTDHRDALILKLLNRVEDLEEKVNSQASEKTKADLEAQTDPYAAYRTSTCANVSMAIGCIVFMIWFMGTITLDVWAGHSKKTTA